MNPGVSTTQSQDTSQANLQSATMIPAAETHLTAVNCPMVDIHNPTNNGTQILNGTVKIPDQLVERYRQENFDTCIVIEEGLPNVLSAPPGYGSKQLYVVNHARGLIGKFALVSYDSAYIIFDGYWIEGDFTQFEAGKYRFTANDGTVFILEVQDQTLSLLYQDGFRDEAVPLRSITTGDLKLTLYHSF